MGEWDLERSSLENGNWRRLAERNVPLSQHQRPTEPRKYTPVQSAELGVFFPSSRVTAWGKQKESHGWIHAKRRMAWAAGENWVQSLGQEVKTGVLMNLRGTGWGIQVLLRLAGGASGGRKGRVGG